MLGAALVGTAFGCQPPAPEAPKPPGPPTTPVAGEAAAPAGDGASTPASTPATPPPSSTPSETAPTSSASEPATPSAPPRPSVAELCEAECVKMDGSCKPRAAEFCRANCDEQVKTAARCPIEVEESLLCQRDTEKEIPCANVIPESCNRKYKAMDDCRSGKVAARSPDQIPSGGVSDDEPPSGWRRYDFAELGISLTLPPEVERSGAERAYRVTSSEAGVAYLVEGLPSTAAKPTDRSILATATGYFGPTCNQRMKLYGRFEKDDIIHVRVETQCKDGRAWYGMLHVYPGRTVITALNYQGKPEVAPPVDSFLYSFRAL
ncbi:MAG TPA: hypothetical protein VLC09_03625 [Polyangiaceae bacterium]|nr:hypothetical protein [Polyangiaceae bacterium]